MYEYEIQSEWEKKKKKRRSDTLWHAKCYNRQRAIEPGTYRWTDALHSTPTVLYLAVVIRVKIIMINTASMLL